MFKRRISVLPGMMIAVIAVIVGTAAFGQEKPRLGILPFTGGSGQEGDVMANLFSNSSDLGQSFAIVPRTSSVTATMKEREFQRSGLTDSDRIAELGRQMNADYVVSGHIAQLGRARLLLISIISVETMQQIAGEYREYREIEEIRELLPSMAKNIIDSRDSASGGVGASVGAVARALAVLPLNIQDAAVDPNEAELLAQILATEITKGRGYAVFPRTMTIEAVMKEQEIQRSGLTDRESIIAIGKATNADYVLAGTITRLGTTNLFDVKILDVTSGVQIKGVDIEYQTLEDGIEVMQVLALKLAGRENEADAKAEEMKRREEEQRRREERAERQAVEAPYRFNSVGASFGSSFAAPWLIFNVGGTYSVWKNTFFDVGLDVGFIHGYQETDVRYSSLYPYAHFNWYWLSGVSLGVGAGLMAAFYETDDEKSTVTTPALDLTAGLQLTPISITYSFRTPFDRLFTAVNHRVTIGYRYRFQ